MTGGTDGGTRATTRTGRPLACVVVNPSKPRATAAVRSLLEDELHEAGYAGPVWLETSVSEPGTMQARLALAAGASLVVAAGGDGTVRSVAAGLAGTGAQMGIVPLGTANLAARNLGVPVGDARAAARVVAHGVDLPADLAWVRTDPWTDPNVLPDPAVSGAPRGRTGSTPSTPLTGRAAAAPPDSPPAAGAPAVRRRLRLRQRQADA